MTILDSDDYYRKLDLILEN